MGVGGQVSGRDRAIDIKKLTYSKLVLLVRDSLLVIYIRYKVILQRLE
jgi:hypothetical protein